MPSITTWNRLEPRPRAPSVAHSLAAPVGDALWMLARQAQLGEWQGEDAGAPAWAELRARTAPFTGWRVAGDAEVRSLSPSDTLERVVQSEPFAPNLIIRAELGLEFESRLAELLGAAAAEAGVAAIRRAHPLPRAPDAPPGPVIAMLDAVFASLLGEERTVPDATPAAFAAAGLVLWPSAEVEVLDEGKRWHVDDGGYGRAWALALTAGGVEVRVEPLPGLAGDAEAARFLHVCAGRAADGWTLLAAAQKGLPILPGSLAPALANALAAAAAALRMWVQEIYGEVREADPPAWRPERLEYAAEAMADLPDGGHALFSADADPQGDFDWHGFDVVARGTGTAPTHTIEMSVIPGHVRFRGMPHARWWAFEAGTTPFGDIKPDRRDLAKLVLMDFMLVHGNDWFIIPLDQPAGSICHVDSLIVRDVFGIDTLIERAGMEPTAPGERWTMFSTSIRGEPDEVADFFLLPPSTAAVAQSGPTREEVRFLRDEMANVAWAVEHTTENAVGGAWPGHERDVARHAGPPGMPAPTQDVAVPLRYVLQTNMPEHWIPFVPVALSGRDGDVALERAVIPDTGSGEHRVTLAHGRVLSPAGLGDTPYRIFEEEIPREGVHVTRTPMRSRTSDGGTRIWIARHTEVGAGEGSSGLSHDRAEQAAAETRSDS